MRKKLQLAGVSSPTSPTRGLEIIRTPGVVRGQEYAERGTCAENILTFDTRLLQISSLEDGIDNNYMDPLQVGIKIVFTT